MFSPKNEVRGSALLDGAHRSLTRILALARNVGSDSSTKRSATLLHKEWRYRGLVWIIFFILKNFTVVQFPHQLQLFVFARATSGKAARFMEVLAENRA
jgi:hypothetical protein